ncbi:MAG TPA: hypothetical protein PK245_03270, partial [Clostridia bacterium]|nr:hypothetical protein [Clostridia bacterium]
DWVIHARVLNVNPVAGAWDISKIYDGTNFYRYSDDTYPTTVANPLQFTLNTHYTVSPADPSLGVVSIDIDIREALFTGINAGLYTNNVRVYYMLYAQDENNYVIEDASGAGYISFTGTILPKQLSATWPTPSSFPYNGVQQGYTPNIIGRVTVSGTVDNVNFVLTGNVATNAGNYTCTITGLSGSKSANYIMPIPSECSGSWSITKISRAVQWSALSVFTYNSQNQGNSVTAWIIGAGDDGNLSLNVTFSGKATTFREAGSYTATASAGATPAELVNYIITAPLTKALTMNPALVVFNWSGSLTPVYNATARTVTATVAASSVFGSDVVTVTAYNNTGTQVAGSSPARYYHNSATDAAYYRAEVTGISNPNYTFTTAATRYVDWRISPAALRLTANNQTFVYNGKYSAPTLSQSNAYSVSLGQIYTRDAGSMFISVSYTASANLFDVGTHNGYIRVTASNSNYDIETVNGALIITKRPIYIQTDAMPWIYNYNMSNFYGSYDNTDKTVFDFANNDISSKLLITNTIDDDVFVINIYFVNQDEGYTDGCVNAVTGATGDPENLDNELLVGRTLHIIRFTLSGDDAYNYLFNYDDTDEEGNLNLYEEDEVGGLISPRELLLGPSYNFRKTYNGTSNLQILSGGTDTVAFSWSFADGAGPLEGVEGAEDVHLTGVVISNGAAGNRTVTSFIITGTAAGNYYLNAPTGGSAYTAVVLKRTVTVEGVLGEDTTISKYYDGTVNYGGSINSSYYTINNVVNGDVLGVNVSSIQFDKSNVLASSAVVYFSITNTVNYQPSSTYFALLGEIVPVTFTVTPVSGLHKLYDRSAWLWSPSGKDSEEIAAVMTYAAAIVEGNTWQGYLTISGTAPYPAGNGYTIVKHGTNPIKLEDAEGVENYIVQLATDVTYTIDKRPIEVTYTNLLQSYRVELVAVGYSSAGGILAEDASDITIDIKNGWLNETYNSLTIIQGSELSNRLGCSLIETQTAESYFIATQPRLVIGYFISAGGEAVERFKVETLEDLLEVGDAYKTGYYGAFVLMNDISGLVNGSATLWTPIAGTADQGYSFMGEFDGGGFTVSDLIIANTAASTWGSYADVGFFASLMGGIVMNLNLRNVTINSYSDFANVGGIAGRSVQGQILDSSFEGKITVRAMSANVGGIAGYATNDSAVGLDRQLQFVSRPNFENLTAVAEILFNGRAGGFESTIGGLIGLAEGIATEAVSISGSFSFADTTLRLATGTTNYAGNLIGKLLFAETDIDTNKFLAAAVGNTRSGVTLNGSSAQVGMVSAAVGNGASLPASALSYNAIAAAAEFGEDLNAEGCIIEIIMNYVLRSDYYYLPAEVFEEFEDSGTVYGTSTNPFEISSYRHIPLLSVYKWASFSLTSDIRLPNSFAAATAEYCYYGALFVNAGGYKLLNANAPAGG